MSNHIIKPQPLNSQNFRKFGELISTKGNNFMTINQGFTKKYNSLATIDTKKNTDKAAIHIFLSKKQTLPLPINMLEKHPFSSQAFIPRHNNPFLIVVAQKGDKPIVANIKAFITDGNQGINYYRGTWHFPLISINDNEQFITIDNINNNKLEDCIVYNFTANTNILLAIN